MESACSGCVLMLGMKMIFPQRDCMCYFLIIFFPQASPLKTVIVWQFCLAWSQGETEPCASYLLPKQMTNKRRTIFQVPFFKELFLAESTRMPVHSVLADLWLRTVASTD